MKMELLLAALALMAGKDTGTVKQFDPALMPATAVSVPAGKDVDGTQIGVLQCGDSTTGVIDGKVDRALGDGTFFDLYEFDLLAGEEATIDFQSDDFDTFLFVFDRADLELGVNDDGGDGTNSRFTFTASVSGTYSLAANNFFPNDEGAYALSLSCAGEAVPDPETPLGPADQWSFLYGWDGFYFQPGNDVDDPVLNQGIAIDLQRGILFAALYTYDQSGGEAFLTLQSTEVSIDGRTYTGAVFRVSGGGNDVEQAGTFTVELIVRNGQNAIRFTIDSPYLTQTGSEWVRFGLAEQDGLSIWAGTFGLFGVSTGDSGANALLDDIGRFIAVDDFRVALSGGDVLEIFLSDDYTGLLGYDASVDRYVISIERLSDPGDGVLIEALAGHNNWVGTAGVFIDDALVTVGNANGLTTAVDKDAQAKILAGQRPERALDHEAMRARMSERLERLRAAR